MQKHPGMFDLTDVITERLANLSVFTKKSTFGHFQRNSTAPSST